MKFTTLVFAFGSGNQRQLNFRDMVKRMLN